MIPTYHLLKEQGSLTLGGLPFAYHIQRSRKRRRTLSLTLATAGEVQVQVPWRTSVKTIEEFITSRSGWILRRQHQVLKQARPTMIYRAGDSLTYLGFTCQLQLTHNAAQPQRGQLLPHRFVVNLHHHSTGEAILASEVKFEVQRWYKRRALQLFRRRLDIWAKRLGVSYGKLAISQAKRRWGSCSATNDIRLNWHLLALPLSLIDYVVAHELCHVVHKNHSRQFWALLARVMPDWQERRHKLANSKSFLSP